jgi:hypothetical protein
MFILGFLIILVFAGLGFICYSHLPKPAKIIAIILSIIGICVLLYPILLLIFYGDR